MNKTIQHYKKEMKNHTLKVEFEAENFKSYLCRNGDDIHFHFRIVFLPNTIFLTGDLGELTLKPYRENTLSWLLNSYDNHPYMMEKVPHRSQDHDKEYNPELAKDHLYEFKEDILERLRDGDITKGVYENTIKDIDKLISRCENFSSEMEFVEELEYIFPDWFDSEARFTSLNERALGRIAQIEKFCELYEKMREKYYETLRSGGSQSHEFTL
jgi:hypothetical protein